MIWLSLALNLAGLAAFALGMNVHRRAVLGREAPPAARLGCKLLGAALQLLSLAVAVLSAGPGAGFVGWTAGLAVGGLALSLLLSLRAR